MAKFDLLLHLLYPPYRISGIFFRTCSENIVSVQSLGVTEANILQKMIFLIIHYKYVQQYQLYLTHLFFKHHTFSTPVFHFFNLWRITKHRSGLGREGMLKGSRDDA